MSDAAQSTNETGMQLAAKKPSLLELMSAEYNLDAKTFQNTLLKTVFPQDKPVTVEQLASFCAVAHEYKLNPLTKEIYAFPAKGGGIVPIVSIDGWISLVQRNKRYGGHSFEYTWVGGDAGGKLLAVKCIIHRNDLPHAIEHTEFMAECVRETEPWKKWPIRMLTHKTFIQCARYAFGLSGIYDPDEGERIAESGDADGRAARAEIQMPARLAPLKVNLQAQPEGVVEALSEGADNVTETHASVAVAGVGESLFPAEERVIGRGKEQRIYAILNKNKLHTEVELKAKYVTPAGVPHLRDLPEGLHEEIVAYASGASAQTPNGYGE